MSLASAMFNVASRHLLATRASASVLGEPRADSCGFALAVPLWGTRSPSNAAKRHLRAATPGERQRRGASSPWDPPLAFGEPGTLPPCSGARPLMPRSDIQMPRSGTYARLRLASPPLGCLPSALRTRSGRSTGSRMGPPEGGTRSSLLRSLALTIGTPPPSGAEADHRPISEASGSQPRRVILHRAPARSERSLRKLSN